MPTVASDIDVVGVAKACGYPNAVSVDSFELLDMALENAKSRNDLSLIKVKCSIGAREDLVRPKTTAMENKQNFMEYLKELLRLIYCIEFLTIMVMYSTDNIKLC